MKALGAFGDRKTFMANLMNTSGLRLEEQVRDLIDKTIERFGRLNGTVNDADTNGQSGVVDGDCTAQ